MAKYRVVSARPKGSSGHLNSEFKAYEWKEGTDGKKRWCPIGWKSIHDISSWMKRGDEVLTGKVSDEKMHDGAAVELELRIAKNDTKYKISDMPDV